MIATCRRRRAGAGVLVVVVGLAGCRQPDGDIPSPTDDQENQIGDIARDLQNVAAGRAEGPSELYDDLYNLTDPAPPRNLLDTVAETLETALAGTSPSDAAARQVADALFIVHRVRELSERQIEELGTELQLALLAAGADEDRALAAAAAAREFQTAMTVNRRRWYQLF